MRILIVSGVVPFPLSEGGKKSQFVLINELSKIAEVHFASIGISSINEPLLGGLQTAIPAIKTHLIRDEKKNKKNNKPFFIKLLEKAIWIYKRLFFSLDEDRPIIENHFFSDPIRPRTSTAIDDFKKLINRIKPDVIQVDFIDYSDLVLLIPAEIKKVLIVHDLRSISLQQILQSSNESAEYCSYVRQLILKKETILMSLFNRVVVFSPIDLGVLQEAHLNNIEVMPFAIDNIHSKLKDEAEYTITKLTFLGPEHHLANKDSLEWYIQEISPLINKKANISLEIAGIWSESTIKKYANISSIKFLGFVEDLNVVLHNSIMIVPIRIGSGIRTKILEAFALGIPVITTSIGVEGLNIKHEQHCYLANSKDEFADAVDKLLSNPSLVAQMRKNALALVKQEYSPQVIGAKRLALYRKI